uniref:Uncharacterized protein n=1 Tax=Pantoea phage Survivor TaxID=3232176 RepID=A0AAU8L184_9CAUD
MTKATNKGFGKVMEARIKELKEGADVHQETRHISFAIPGSLSEKKELKFGTELEVVEHAVDLINGFGLAVEAATTELAHDNFADTKIERWDASLKLFDGMTMNSDVRLREVVGEDTIYGSAETFIDHPHSQEMVSWYSDFSSVNEERAKKLFD